MGLNWKKFTIIGDKKFLRPAEVVNLKGDATKAKKILRWKPKYDFYDICESLLINDLKIYGMTIEQAKQKAKKLKIR